MAHLLIWGDTREILAGGAPPGTPVEEVRSLAALQSVLDGRVAGAMVLADPHCLEAEREKTERWLRNGGSAQAFLVTVTDADEGDEVLNRLPFVDDVLVRPVTPIRLLRRLERGMDIIRNRRVIRQLEEKLNRRGDELSELNKIGVALSAERDIDKLLELILQKSREITGADAGSLYLVERAGDSGNTEADRLRFELAQNDTVKVPFEKSTMPLDKAASVAGYVAVTGDMQNVPDAYRLPKDSPFQISRSFDEKSGYRSKSMLVVPMRDHDEVVIGVVQLINKKRNRLAVLRPTSLVEDEVITFTSEDEKLASSLASQAAVAFENADLLRRIRQLFDQFIEAAVTAVEQRDPPTSDHSRRVAVLTVGLAKKVDAIASGPLASVTLTPEQLQELRYAALLHDFGKVAVQEKFLRKKKKLYAGQMTEINQRFAYILKCIEADHLRAQLGVWDPERPLLRRLTGLLRPGATAKVLRHLEDEYRGRRAEVERLREAVVRANEPSVLPAGSFSAFVDLPTRQFADDKEQDDFPVEAWAEPPYLSSAEVEALSVRKGSLTHEQKGRINEHVQKTYEFLIKIPWTGDLKRIPEIAWAHHEKLNGSGYPRKLTAAEIPPQSRMMTISDIYDALVAQDRPYKKAVPPETALGYLEDEVKEGLLDGDLLRVFIDAKIWDLPEFKALIRHRT
jgi:HD-GYP domain-containing protein (c-di-GMP phosphodiesterase class II)